MNAREAGDPGADGSDGLRRRITAEAARSVAAGHDARRAVFRAARRAGHGWVSPERLPGVAEVRAAAEAASRASPPAAAGDRFGRIAALVGLLVSVRRDPATHPEGDALEHALQVFGIVHAERSYDEELLTAALVREVGLVLDRAEPLAAGLEALGDLITPRTRWLIEAEVAARAYVDRTLGHRARLRLAAHEDFEAALLLVDAVRRGRVRGGIAPSLDEALAILRDLDREDAEDEADG